MASRRPFGGTAPDFVWTAVAGVIHVGVSTVTFWDSETDGTKITDLIDQNGNPASQIITDASGRIPRFQGPDDDTNTMWADAGGGARSQIFAADFTTYLKLQQLVLQPPSGFSGQMFQIFDELNAPIASTGTTGGDNVFGDDVRVFPGGDVFNPIERLRSDGTTMLNGGDVAGGVGVFSLGAATTPPTAKPDGSHLLGGSDTDPGGVGWTDANGRFFWRRVNGISQQLDGAHVHGSHNVPVVGDWLLPATTILSTQALTSGDASKMFLVPIDVTDTAAVYNKVGALASVAGVDGGGGTFIQFRHGIYKDDGTGTRPLLSAQVADFGIASGGFSSLLGLTPTATLSPTFSFPAPGRYWHAVAFTYNGTPGTFPTINTAHSSVMNSGSDLSAYSRGWYVASVTGVLPTSGTLVATQVVPFVGLRRSA